MLSNVQKQYRNSSMKEDKFNKIVQENSERIRRICRYYNSNVQDQDDMFQEILINIWKSLENFRGDASISTWIYRIAVNTALTFTGKAYKNMKLTININDVNQLNILDFDNDIESKEKLESQFEALQNELNILSVIDKSLISLTLEGLSMKEIAQVIGITESNVKVKIHRIKQQLKDNLRASNYETK